MVDLMYYYKLDNMFILRKKLYLILKLDSGSLVDPI